MFGMHPSLVETFQKRKFEQQQLDSIQQAIEKVEFDPLEERMHITQTANMRLAALSIVLQLALMIDNGQDDVDSDEILLPSDMLDNLMLSVFDDGIDDDEADTDEKASYDGMMFDKAGRPKQELSVGKTTTKQINGKNIKYKAVKAVRNGEIVTVNKRVEGNITLSSKQKNALKKAQQKANTGYYGGSEANDNLDCAVPINWWYA